MVKRLRKWNERLTTLVVDDRGYIGHVEFTDLELANFCGQVIHEYHYTFRTNEGERIPIYSQGRYRVAALDGKLVQKATNYIY